MNPGTLLIRADASVAIGTGHVMRCLALGECWRAFGGEVVCVMCECSPSLEKRLAESGFRLTRISGLPASKEDLQNLRKAVENELPRWIVLDGYKFDANYQSALKRLGRLLVIDDNGGVEYYSADLILNQNVHACEQMYERRSPETELLLGPQYALLRSEFARYSQWKREIRPQGSRVLLSMGGSDPTNFGSRILPALCALPRHLEVRIVIGGTAAQDDFIDAVEHGSSVRVEVVRDVRNMAELMAWADLAIAGAGTICWELCCLGLPAILVVAAENQRLIARKLDAVGAAINAGDSANIDCGALAQCAQELLASLEQRRGMSRIAKRLVDGLGTERVLRAMLRGDLRCA